MLWSKIKKTLKKNPIFSTSFFRKEENILSIKISVIAFFALFLCLSFLVLMNGLYLSSTEKNKFIEDIKFFEANYSETLPNPFLDSRTEFMDKIKKRVVIEQLLRDSIIVDETGEMQKLGIFQYIDVDFDDLIKEANVLFVKKYEGNIFLMYHMYIGGNNVYFSRDISFITAFQDRLIVNALLLSIIFVIIIFFFSIKLSRLTIRPIKEHNKKLQEYNHNLAHEMKTPLAVLKGNIELAEMTNNTCNINGSREEIQSMEDIINGLLFLSESMVLKEKEKINFLDFLDDFIPSLHLQKKVVYNVVSSKRFIYADKILLKRLLKNLLENADKYGEGEEIFIEAEMSGFSVQNNTSLNVSDNILIDIFEPFYQLDSSHHGKGYGLGLSIVKRICDTFHWDVLAKIENGKFIIVVRYK